MAQGPHILILAAGQGKRMRSKLPKVLHPVLFRPMIHHILDLAHSLPHQSITLVVGHGEEKVREACRSYPDLQFVRQEKQLGTADAVRSAEKLLAKKSGHVLILSGDVFLLREEGLKEFLGEHLSSKAVGSFLTANLPDPTGYGRVLRNKGGDVTGIIEHGDASEEQKTIGEINSGIYCFEIASLFHALKNVKSKNTQKEFYLTDVIEKFVLEKKKVIAEVVTDWRDIMGVNDRAQLEVAEKVMQTRINYDHMLRGVRIQFPESVWIDPRCKIAPDVTIEMGVTLVNSTVDEDATIEAHSRVLHSKIGKKVVVKQGSYIQESEIGEQSQVGPYAHLRPGSVLKNAVKIGNFVELKKTIFSDGSKASHLSYIGDAKVGKNVNLGCGFITCNYDGKKKHETVIEDGVFVGSDSQVVAPVKIGKGSYIASGSTVTEDVPPQSLVISRGKQITKKGYAKKYQK